jgi:predicted transcriptional regulator
VYDDILISLSPRHVNKILDGTKTVELRRRRIAVRPGTRVWIYSKVPRGQVEALGIVKEVIERHPCRIWQDYRHTIGISLEEFYEYFRDRELGHAIVFQKILLLRPALSLNTLRKQVLGFHPPQFFKRLAADGPELSLFCSAIS